MKITPKFLKMLVDHGVTHYRDADGLELRLGPAPAPVEEPMVDVREPLPALKGDGADPITDADREDLGLPPEKKRPRDWSPS